MARYNKDQLRDMEEEFLKLQKIEIAIDSSKGKTSQLITSYASSVKTYTDQKRLQSLIDDAESIIAEIAQSGQVRGKVMSLKTMSKYLDQSERQNKTQRMLDIIARQNAKKAQERASLYVDEMLKDANIMKADIDLFRKQGRISGLTDNEINKRLVEAANSNASPVDAFGKRLKTLEKAVLRREANATEIDEYKKSAKPNEKWQWITVSTGPCPDCRIRAGVTLTFVDWQKRGLPGDGRTICRSSCMCKLIPVSIAEDLFTEVKTFKWNKEDGVLTTYNEMRTFGAEGNKSK